MKNVLFRFDAYEEIGMGHAYRCSQLIRQLPDCRCTAAISIKSTTPFNLLNKENIPYVIIHNDEDLLEFIKSSSEEIVVNDILNTDADYIIRLKECGCRVINLEDEGNGSIYADAVINELYEKADVPANAYYGKNYYCLPESLIGQKHNQFNDKVSNVLLLFGRTDPTSLTQKTLDVINEIDDLGEIKIKVVVGPENIRRGLIEEQITSNVYKNQITVVDGGDLGSHLQHADFAISSQGRTIFELAHMAVPTIIMAQNKREMLHTFATIDNGFINLGLGTEVKQSALKGSIEVMIHSEILRRNLYDVMCRLHLQQGVERVKKIILGE